jgi:hypothetical protein
MKLPNIIFGLIKDGNTGDSFKYSMQSFKFLRLKKVKIPYSKILKFMNKGFLI